MKTILSILVALTSALRLSAGETNSPTPLKIGASEANKYYDQEMIVTGQVAQVTIRQKVVFLNLDQPFPDSPFTVVVFPSVTNNFGNIKSLDWKNIEVQGKIKNYHDKPEIILDSTNQLRVITN